LRYDKRRLEDFNDIDMDAEEGIFVGGLRKSK